MNSGIRMVSQAHRGLVGWRIVSECTLSFCGGRDRSACGSYGVIPLGMITTFRMEWKGASIIESRRLA